MKQLSRDENGEVGFALFVIVLVALVFIILPIIIGWAIIFLWQFFTEDVEVYSLWFKWLLGMALVIVAIVIKPSIISSPTENNYYRNMQEKNHSDSDDEDDTDYYYKEM